MWAFQQLMAQRERGNKRHLHLGNLIVHVNSLGLDDTNEELLHVHMEEKPILEVFGFIISYIYGKVVERTRVVCGKKSSTVTWLTGVGDYQWKK